MSDPSLLNDVLFKIVFGTSHSEPILTALLNALLSYTGDQRIESLTIDNPALDKEYISDKGVVLDLKAVDRLGRWFNIEVQLQATLGRENYFKRSLYYWSKLFVGQLEPGQSYSKLEKTICISLLDFELFPNTSELHSTYTIKERSTNDSFFDLFELHYIELRKFALHKSHILRTPFERWLHILKFSEIYARPGTELPQNLQQEEGISMAIETMRKAYAKDEVRELIQMREKALRDYESGLEDALEKGREEERARADAAEQERDAERQRAEQERQKAERERQRAELLAARLRELGVDPD